MGQTVSAEIQEMAVVDQKEPLFVTEQRFCVPHQTTVNMREKLISWTGDDFDVTDIEGNPLFKIKGKFFSLREKKVLSDYAGTPVLNIRHVIFDWLPRYQLFSGENDGPLIGEVQTKWSWGTNMEVNLNKLGTSETIKLTLLADNWSRVLYIFHGPPEDKILIARTIRVNCGSCYDMNCAQTYQLEIAANVDTAIMLAMTVIVDELNTSN